MYLLDNTGMTESDRFSGHYVQCWSDQCDMTCDYARVINMNGVINKCTAHSISSRESAEVTLSTHTLRGYSYMGLL